MTPIIVTCLGHGGAFSPLSIGNTSFLVDHGTRRILVDCGTTVPESLAEIGVDPGSITHCLITHLHQDHCGGLERLLYHRYYINQAARLPLIMGEEVASDWFDITKTLRNDLDRHAVLRPLGANCCMEVPDNGEEFTITARRVYHGGDIPTMPGYSFLLELGASSVFFSGDRIWKHDGDHFVLKDMAAADLAFHEIEMSPKPSGAHTHQSDVADYRRTENVYWTHHGAKTRDPLVRLAIKGDQWKVAGRHVLRFDNLFADK